ncbi:zinc-binding dehydrogenase [Microdochium trichocladiopsis]|uniref:enoyl-[acyl-carrier-protein] reductase n=1 Tax=Microdochium trichocladiopsis TaxID=1682393 RepID=A0A9P8YDF8_9PEZI|nr:zinc-binding dehydrogenase [Microdochium trichocladiopsis]KAH7037308.1 zinc-binding dehydrogenase [Microdochium trichocladiopsis]
MNSIKRLSPAAARGTSALLRQAGRPQQTSTTAQRLGAWEPVRHKSGPYGYTQAKSLVYSKYGEPKDVLKLHTHSISPSFPQSTVLLRTLASSINPADVNTIQGTYGVKPTFSPLIGTTEPSVIPGNEAVFEVVNVSSPDLKVSRGDWVIPAKTGFGTWRTHALALEGDVLRVNKQGLNPTQAATAFVNPCSAYRMLRDFAEPALREGDWFIQNGANSGVGRAAIQLGRLWGYRSINVVRARDSPEKTQELKDELAALGATHVVTEDEFLSREFKDMVAQWTRGSREGIKLGMNCVGGKSAQTIAKTLGPGGAVVTYGGMSRQPVALPTGLLIFKNIRFLGFWLSRWADRDVAAKERTVNEILDLIREGKFKDVPTVEVPWSWETEEGVLRDAVQGTLEGFRAGKGVFVFGET